MKIRKTGQFVAALGVLSCAVLSGMAQASSVALSEELLAGGSLVSSGSVAVTALSSPGTYTYSQSFGGAQTVISGSPSPGFGFYDDYVFSVPTSQVDTIASTISLGQAPNQFLNLQNFQVRLYNITGNPNLPVLLTPSSTPLDSWSSMINYSASATGTVDVIPDTAVGAGTYVLEVRGETTGIAGGSYTGVLDVSPVPVPATLPLLFSGMGLLGALRRRARA